MEGELLAQKEERKIFKATIEGLQGEREIFSNKIEKLQDEIDTLRPFQGKAAALKDKMSVLEQEVRILRPLRHTTAGIRQRFFATFLRDTANMLLGYLPPLKGRSGVAWLRTKGYGTSSDRVICFVETKVY